MTNTTAEPDPRDERTRAAQEQYREVMTYPGLGPTKPYYDAGVVGFVFGEVWPRPALSRRDRRWVTLACVGAAGAPVPIQTHVFAAINSGDCTLQELREFNLHVATQMGWPKGQVIDQYIDEACASIAPTRADEPVDAEFPRWSEPAPEGERRLAARRHTPRSCRRRRPRPTPCFAALRISTTCTARSGLARSCPGESVASSVSVAPRSWTTTCRHTCTQRSRAVT